MRKRIRRIAALAVGSAGLLLVAGGATAGGAASSLPDLSSRSAIESYLQSIGVDPATMTWQQGLLNYAGPSCPGVGWNCTTSTNVVQITQAGGENKTECSGKPEDTTTTTVGDQSCIIVQTAPAKGENHAKCEEKSDDATVVQVCDITQENVGGGNHADVKQENHTSADPTQDARQFARVTQDSEGGNNHSDIHQDVHQSIDEGTTQQQDAHQVAFVDQSVTGSSNFSHVHQTQDQKESGNAATQNQNTAVAPTIMVGTEVFDFDCGPEKVAEPNQCANVFQDGTLAPSGAHNDSHLHQAIGEQQASKFAGVSQQQGRIDGGQEGNVHQQNPTGLGHNDDHADQKLAQRQSAPNGVTFGEQLTDPGCCGFGSQVGGDKNNEDINQSTTQSSDSDTFQSSTLFGQVHETSGGDDIDLLSVQPTQVETPDNKCSIDQHGRNNDGSGHFSVTGDGLECEFLTLETTCTSGGVEIEQETPACTSSEGGGGDSLDLPAVLTIPSTATLGLPIEMPDYTAEPDAYLNDPLASG